MIELLVALVVIGLLAALAIGKAREVKQKAYVVAMKNDLHNYALAQELYLDRHTSYAAVPESITTFHFSQDVATLAALEHGARWFLSVQHSKTPITCSLAIGEGSDNAIHCPGDPLDFTMSPWNPAQPGAVRFDGTGTLAGLDTLSAALCPTGQTGSCPWTNNYVPQTVTWTFGDGSPAVSGTPTAVGTQTHVYADTGVYAVAMAVLTQGGNRLMANRTLVIGRPARPSDGGTTSGAPADTVVIAPIAPNRPPTAAFTWGPASPFATMVANFDASASSDPDGDALTYAWDTDDWQTATGVQVSLSFATPGAHTMRLIVTDTHGAADSLTQAVTVLSAAPVAQVTATPVTPTTAQSVAFDGSGSSSPVGSIARFDWNFGDGATAPNGGATATHTYATAGSYTATLTVSDTAGRQSSATVSISVTQAAASGAAWAWGYNNAGQIGDGTTTDQYSPVSVSGAYTASSLAPGAHFTCALNTAGAASCWGDNAYGNLGDGTTVAHLTPAPVAGGLTFTQVVAGNQSACAVTGAGAVYCWGTTYGSTPVLVSGSLTFASLSAGGDHTCGLTTAGVAYCWGANQYQQSGIVSAQSRPNTPVAGNLTFVQIAAGGWHTCARTAAGALYCWGWNQYGQLGNGGTTQSYTPVLVGGGLTWADVALRAFATCGLTTSGAAYCWGDGRYYSLGTGSWVVVLSPALVKYSQTFTAITAGYDHACGLTAGGTAYCWGGTGNGSLGVGPSVTGVGQYPTAVVGGHVFQVLRSSSAANHTLAF